METLTLLAGVAVMSGASVLVALLAGWLCLRAVLKTLC